MQKPAPSDPDIRGLLIDLSGVVYQGGSAIEGSVEAVARLDEAGMPYRFLTNTTSQSLTQIVGKLGDLGIDVDPGQIFTPAIAARRYLAEKDLAPHFLVAPALHADFGDLPEGGDPAVVIGDAGEGFTYAALNDAFRRLESGAELIALATNRLFMDAEDRPTLDVGAFVAALEYASGKDAVVLGKPAPDFFRRAAAEMELAPENVAMIGDDAEFDVIAAIEAGLSGYLVLTGKGKPSDLPREPTAEFDNLHAAVSFVLEGGEPHP